MATTIAAVAPPTGDNLIDQSFTEPRNLGCNINEGASYVAQTYTAGVTGRLTGLSIDVHSKREMNPDQGCNFYRLHVALCVVRDGYPDAVLAEKVLDADEAQLDTVITFPENPVQIAGTQYAIVVHYVDAPPAGPDKWIGNWFGATGNQYPGGELFYGPNGRTWFASSLNNHDVHFRTYVELE